MISVHNMPCKSYAISNYNALEFEVNVKIDKEQVKALHSALHNKFVNICRQNPLFSGNAYTHSIAFDNITYKSTSSVSYSNGNIDRQIRILDLRTGMLSVVNESYVSSKIQSKRSEFYNVDLATMKVIGKSPPKIA